jgi:hypothetical protein
VIDGDSFYCRHARDLVSVLAWVVPIKTTRPPNDCSAPSLRGLRWEMIGDMTSMKERLRGWARRKAAKFGPHDLVAGAVSAIGTFVVMVLFPPVSNGQLTSATTYGVKVLAAGAAFVVTSLLAESRRNPGRVFLVSASVVVTVVSLYSTAAYYLTTRQASELHRQLAAIQPVVQDNFDETKLLNSPRQLGKPDTCKDPVGGSANINGSGEARIDHGLLTLTLCSLHVANQQYLVFDIAPKGGDYYVETRTRRQHGPAHSGCFLAFGVVNEDQYLLFDVTSEPTLVYPAQTAVIAQEVSARPFVERILDHSPPLPYVQRWSLLWPPGADQSWTTLGVRRVGTTYDFYVDDRRISHITDLYAPNSRVTVGAFDPGTTNGSFVGCEFRYLRGWAG